MPSLSDKLKSLGVKIGTGDLPPQVPYPSRTSLDEILTGHTHQTSLGETYLVEKFYPADYQHGNSLLEISAPLQTLATWARDPGLSDLPSEAFAFIDTETTGLSGGTGTYAFLIGAGRFERNEFHLVQFFMRDPLEEPAQLFALEDFLAPCRALVTYNGKAFDLPLLAARFRSHGWRFPLKSYAHVDLLHLSRRLWRDRLPSRTLGNIEAHILGTKRNEEDVPGWMIPQMYFDYLRSGDAHPLRSVFYHNAMDIVSLVTLLNHSAGLLADPLANAAEYGVDLLALAQLFEDLGDFPSATRLYLHGLEHHDIIEGRVPSEVYLRAIERLAYIYKKGDLLDQAVELWVEAARHQHLESHIELAKHFEHRIRDYTQALYWTQTAIELINLEGFPRLQHRIILPELEHRKERLLHKLER